MKPLILAAIVLALLWRSRRKPAPPYFVGIDRADGVDTTVTVCRDATGVFHIVDVQRAAVREDDDGLLPVDPYTWTLA